MVVTVFAGSHGGLRPGDQQLVTAVEAVNQRPAQSPITVPPCFCHDMSVGHSWRMILLWKHVLAVKVAKAMGIRLIQ